MLAPEEVNIDNVGELAAMNLDELLDTWPSMHSPPSVSSSSEEVVSNSGSSYPNSIQQTYSPVHYVQPAIYDTDSSYPPSSGSCSPKAAAVIPAAPTSSYFNAINASASFAGSSVPQSNDFVNIDMLMMDQANASTVNTSSHGHPLPSNSSSIDFSGTNSVRIIS